MICSFLLTVDCEPVESDSEEMEEENIGDSDYIASSDDDDGDDDYILHRPAPHRSVDLLGYWLVHWWSLISARGRHVNISFV